jgi:hypothetical protein
METFTRAFLTVLVVSGFFIGCDFIDNNSPNVDLGSATEISVKYDGLYKAAIDTAGWDGP